MGCMLMKFLIFKFTEYYTAQKIKNSKIKIIFTFTAMINVNL